MFSEYVLTFDDVAIEVPLLDYDEIRIAVVRLRYNNELRADGLPAEFCRYGRKELI